jgi:hypothetical protein
MNKAHLFKHLKGDTDIEKLEYLRSIGHPKNGPIYVQQKYNGVHVRLEVNDILATFYSKPSDKYPDGKPYRPGYFAGVFGDLLTHLTSLRNTSATVNYYGELLIPNTRLQDIAGEVAVNRNEIGEYARKAAYVVFYDRFDTGDLIVNQPFSSRYKKLVNDLAFFEGPNRAEWASVEVCHDVATADALYTRALTLNHEGVMYRVDPCFMVDGAPTWHFIKRKQRYDMEGTVLIVHEGKGKHQGHLGSLEVILPSGAKVGSVLSP